MTRAVWVGQARVWVGHGLPGLIARTASGASVASCPMVSHIEYPLRGLKLDKR